jgi:hypothetical protein
MVRTGSSSGCPANWTAYGCFLLRCYAIPNFRDLPYSLAEVFEEDPAASTLLNAYLLDGSASGAERVNRHRAITQLKKQVFPN